MSSLPVDPESAATRSVIDNLFAAAATGVTAEVLEWWHEDGVLDDITIAQRFRGHAELDPYLEWYYRALPDLDFTPARIIVHGGLASVEWAEKCHLEQPFDDLPADGRELRIRAMDLFGIHDGKVAWESSWYGDAWLRRRLSEPVDGPDAPPPALPRGDSWEKLSGPDERGDAPGAETSEVIDRLFAAAATGDTTRVLEWWAEDGVLDDVTLAMRVRGHDELRAYLDEYYAGLPDLEFTPRRVLIDGPWALVEWAERCHVAAPFFGATSDGRELRLRAVDTFEVRDGKVVWESGWYGDGWLIDRLTAANRSNLPPELPFGATWDEES
jgi:steroid delta-isomerase-like uncharacterized protein